MSSKSKTRSSLKNKTFDQLSRMQQIKHLSFVNKEITRQHNELWQINRAILSVMMPFANMAVCESIKNAGDSDMILDGEFVSDLPGVDGKQNVKITAKDFKLLYETWQRTNEAMKQ